MYLMTGNREYLLRVRRRRSISYEAFLKNSARSEASPRRVELWRCAGEYSTRCGVRCMRGDGCRPKITFQVVWTCQKRRCAGGFVDSLS